MASTTVPRSTPWWTAGAECTSSTLEDVTDWAAQPAITRIGSTLYVFYNRVREVNRRYELCVRVLRNGTFTAPVVLDSRATFPRDGVPRGAAHRWRWQRESG
jgi:hypothetical protein